MPVVAVDEAVVEVAEVEAVVVEAEAEVEVEVEAVETMSTTTIWIPPLRVQQDLPGFADDDAAPIDC